MSHHGHLWHGSETLHGNHPMRDTIGWHDGDTRRGRYWDQTRVVDVSLEKEKKLLNLENFTALKSGGVGYLQL